MVQKLKAGFDEALSEVRRRGLLLVHDAAFPSLTRLMIGEPTSGSWWAHPLSNEVYVISQRLQHCGEVAMTKLVSGKETYVHRNLWPHLVAMGISREEWQLDSLAASTRELREMVDRAGSIRIDQIQSMRPRKELSEDARTLAARLLVYADDVHTDSGAHARRLETWKSWANRHKVAIAELPSASEAREKFEHIVLEANEEHSASAFLAWQKKPKRKKDTR